MQDASGDGSNASSFARSNTFLQIFDLFSSPYFGALEAKSLASSNNLFSSLSIRASLVSPFPTSIYKWGFSFAI